MLAIFFMSSAGRMFFFRHEIILHRSYYPITAKFDFIYSETGAGVALLKLFLLKMSTTLIDGLFLATVKKKDVLLANREIKLGFNRTWNFKFSSFEYNLDKNYWMFEPAQSIVVINTVHNEFGGNGFLQMLIMMYQGEIWLALKRFLDDVDYLPNLAFRKNRNAQILFYFCIWADWSRRCLCPGLFWWRHGDKCPHIPPNYNRKCSH